jgi:hypothetical protein
MSEPKKWVGYADLLEAKRQREERAEQIRVDETQTDESPTTPHSSAENSKAFPDLPITNHSLTPRKANSTSLANFSGQANSTSLAKTESSVQKFARQAESADQANFANHQDSTTPDLFAGLPEARGFLRLSYQVIDHLFPLLDPSEQSVYLHLFRLTYGFNKPTCVISYPGIARRSGMSARSAQDVTKRLEAKGLVRRVGRVIGTGKEQGNEFRVAIPASLANSASPANSATIIEETHIKETHTNTEGVRVGSRFTLQECRKYADSLRADGITNPGGYATKIHRSGEADDLITAFLEPVASAKPIDVSGCPNCHGTGFWEPGGAGKGVAKCKHERVLRQ